MADTATEAPAAYVLATQLHDTVREILDSLDHRHDYLALELLKYSERIMGNVGAAEAPFAAARRKSHYEIAFAAACGCAAACDLVLRLRLAPRPLARRANRLLGSLASIIRPIAEDGHEARSAVEDAILGDVFRSLAGDAEPEPWQDDADPAADPWEDDDDDETW